MAPENCSSKGLSSAFAREGWQLPACAAQELPGDALRGHHPGVGPAQDRHVRQQQPLEAALPGALGDLRHARGADEVLSAAWRTEILHAKDAMMHTV